MGPYRSRAEECVTCTLMCVAIVLMAALLWYEAYKKGAFSGQKKEDMVSVEVWNKYSDPKNK